MSWAEQKAKRLLVPWDEDTPDSRGFWNYVQNHYERCIEKSWEIAKKHGGSEQEIWSIANVILDKLASPLVYLYEAWTIMAPEKKAKYSPELAKIHERVKKEVDEAFKP